MGIEDCGKLAFVGMVRLIDFGTNIAVIAIREECRDRGYAMSIVSALVMEILRISQTAVIHVKRDNASAVRAYSKVGYKPYRTCLSVRT